MFSRLLGRWRGAVVALACIATYTILVGAGASVVRAALMGELTLFAAQLGRRQDGLNTLAIVILVMALANPNVLWDVGFQLSFMATLGLVLYAGALTGAFARLAGNRVSPETVQKLSRPVMEYLLFTLAATLTTLPVIAYQFQRLSIVSILANPFILPAQPPLMVLGGLSLIAGSLFEPVGRLLAVELFASLPGSALSIGPVPLVWVGGFYTILFGMTFFGGRFKSMLAGRLGSLRPAMAAVSGVALLVIGVGAALAWSAYYAAPHGRLHLTVLDVGSGDAMLIQTPGGRYALVDGGPSPSRLSDALGRRLPVGAGLDFLVVAASGDEQVGALADVLPRYEPEQVLWAGPPDGSRSARRLQEGLAEVDIVPLQVVTGQILDLGGGAHLEVLAVSKRGAVLWLEWNDFRALLPVGIDFETLEELQADPDLSPVTALLLADSGYAPTNPPEWIEMLNPQAVLLSVAAGDREGRPDPETLEAVEGYTLLRTDRNGWIELSTDGEQMRVEAERR